MTDARQRIAEIRARADKAFPGPWTPGIYHSDIWAPSEKGGDTKIMDIRGWGYLTGKGSGALGLPEDEAIARQKDLAEFVAGCRDDAPWLCDQLTAALQHIAELTKERDAAIEERNLAQTGTKIAITQRDAAYQDGQIAMRRRVTNLVEGRSVVSGYANEHELPGFEAGVEAAERCIAKQIRALQPEAKEQ